MSRPDQDPPVVAAERYVRQPIERSAPELKLKRVVQAAFRPMVGHRLLAMRLASLALGRERAFLGASESIARIPGQRGIFARQAFYRRTLAFCGRDVYFGWLSVFSNPLARVGEGVYIGRRCSIGLAEIGERTLLADGVQLLSGAHQHGRGDVGGSPQDEPQVVTRIQVGPHSWLGTNAVIMADVGEGAIVGAGAVVTTPIPPRTVAAGVPARVLREIG